MQEKNSKTSNIVFGTGGLRDIFEHFSPLDAFSIATYFSELSQKAEAVALGYDGRTTCIPLYNAAAAGILATGKNVKDLGVVPTPALAYYTQKYSIPGIIATASHNPLNYVGMKFFANGIEISKALKNSQFDEEEKSQAVEWHMFKQRHALDFSHEYCKAALSNCKFTEKHTIFIDCAGLSTSLYVPKSLAIAGMNIISTNTTIMSIERELEPKEENLLNAVKIATASDIGFAFDGDGDRCRVILGNKVLTEEQQLLLMTYYMIKYGKSQTIVSTVECSTSVKKMVEELGAKIFITPVGSANVAKEAKEKEALFGGEPCGEYVFPEFHYCADGILTSLKFIELIENVDWKNIVEEYDTYFVARTKIRASENVSKALEIISKSPEKLPCIDRAEIENVDLTDGIKIIFKSNKGFVLLRKSGTEKAIRITVEQESKKEAEQMCEQIKLALENA